MNVKLKIYFTDDTGSPFMGIGVFWLLQGIRKYGSIRKAALGMDLSYAKAHSMLNNLEKGLGLRVLERKRGGDSRDGTVLTPEGERLIELYDDYQHRVKSFAEKEFDVFLSYFGNIT